MSTRSIERLHHRLLVRRIDRAGPHALAELEHRLHHTQLRRRGIQPGNRHPIIHDHARAHNRTTPIHAPRDQRHLQQTRQLILILNRGLGVHDPALVAQRHVAPRQHVIRNRLPEDFDAEDVGDYFFGFAFQVWVDEGYVVVCADYVSERREAFFDALDFYAVGDRVAEVLEFLVGCGGGDEEAFFVSGCEAADDAGAGDCAVADWYYVLQFGFEDAVGGEEGISGVVLGEPVWGLLALTCRSSRRRRRRRGRRSL